LNADTLARLRLIRTRSIGPVTYFQLLQRFGSAQAALDAIPDLARRGGGTAPRIPAAAEIEREAETVASLGARYLIRGDSAYPALLAEIDTAPPALIVAGDIALANRPCVGMVGARNASAAAIRFARMLAHGLAEQGLIVVSGLARGIDTAAHEGSIERGTIGVIAGGIDIVYPPENDRLQRAIARQGLLIAEQPPGTEPRARHFPYRNRIIAGLAQGRGRGGRSQIGLAHHRAAGCRFRPRRDGGARLAARSARAGLQPAHPRRRHADPVGRRRDRNAASFRSRSRGGATRRIRRVIIR
jgi:DNA processing protein